MMNLHPWFAITPVLESTGKSSNQCFVAFRKYRADSSFFLESYLLEAARQVHSRTKFSVQPRGTRALATPPNGAWRLPE